MIRSAKKEDLIEIVKLIQAVVLNMQRRGSTQWDESYPTKNDYLKDIVRNELYVDVDHEKMTGLFTLSPRGHEEYDSIAWKSEKPAWTLKRLAVHPNHYGQGIADQFIVFAEDLAKSSAIYRLNTDTYSDNENAQKLFKRHDFELVDQQADPRTGALLFYYEKILIEEGQ